MKLFIVPLPPPMHGQAKVSKDTIELFDEKIVLDINYDDKGLFKNLYSFIIYLIKFYIYIVKYDIDLIYISISRSKLGALRDLPVVLLSYYSNIKVIGHIHGGDFDSFLLGINPFLRKKMIRLYASCKNLIVPLKEIENEIQDKVGLENIITINNYLKNINTYKCDLEHNNSGNILFMSNILKTKGINEFLRMVEKLSKYNINFDAKVAGGFKKGHEAEKREVLQKDKEGLIEYLGFIEDEKKKEELAKCDFFVLPSYSEAFPLVILEAMASGCIIIISDKKYHKFLVENSFGRVFDFNNDMEDILNFIVALNEKPEKKKMMKQSAVEQSRHYIFDHYEQEIKDLMK